MKRSAVAWTLAVALGLPATGWAQGTQGEFLELLDALRANGTLDEATYERLRASVAEKGLEEDIDAPNINTKGKFEVTSPDGDFSMRVGGRIQVDAGVHEDDDIDLGSGTELRRARLFVSGTLWRDWGYKLQYDFAGDAINDAFLQYSGWESAVARVGHFKEPFSLANMTSSKYVTFIERALPHTFTPGRNIGVAGYTNGDNWSFSAGLFGEGADNPGLDDQDEGVDEGHGASARVTFAPVATDTRLVHLGGALSYRSPTEDTVRFRERPESHITDVRLVDTGPIAGEGFNRYGLEAAYIAGPLSLQGEYMRLDVDRDAGADPTFDGYYLQAGWFLTGESRASAYSVKKGAFGKIAPRGIAGMGGPGAWQVAVRYSSIDLSDAGIDGGEERNATFGLNWFATPTIRFSANYVQVLEVDGGTYDGEEPAAFLMRGQVEF